MAPLFLDTLALGLGYGTQGYRAPQCWTSRAALPLGEGKLPTSEVLGSREQAGRSPLGDGLSNRFSRTALANVSQPPSISITSGGSTPSMACA